MGFNRPLRVTSLSKSLTTVPQVSGGLNQANNKSRNDERPGFWSFCPEVIFRRKPVVMITLDVFTTLTVLLTIWGRNVCLRLRGGVSFCLFVDFESRSRVSSQSVIYSFLNFLDLRKRVTT